MPSIEIQTCPLCGSKEAHFHSHSLPNLYSEKIAEMIGVEEDEIISEHANLKCDHCGLIYKKNWFSSGDLDTLFKTRVPSHPKGWDVVSGRFSVENFYHEVELYSKALREKDQENINRYKRALSSIIDSIDGFRQSREGKQMLDAIASEAPADLEAYRQTLVENLKEPSAFKRFSGFSAPILWEYIEKKCNGIRNYAELGCPLWGLLPLAGEKKVPAKFYQRKEVNYWSENCKSKGMHCSAFLHSNYGIPLQAWEEKPKEKQHVLGFFQYLDHLEEPLPFMEEVFTHFEVAAVILDGVDLPLAIQHFTGFTEESLAYIAKHFNKTLHTDFEAIKPSNNVLYLFT